MHAFACVNASLFRFCCSDQSLSRLHVRANNLPANQQVFSHVDVLLSEHFKGLVGRKTARAFLRAYKRLYNVDAALGFCRRWKGVEAQNTKGLT